jgi:DNA repair protein RadC
MGATETGVPLTEVVRTHVGRHDQATLYGMELLRPVVFCPAMVMCHSHPNGAATPSPADREFTANVATGFARLGLRLLEHYIIAGNGGYARLLADHMPELAAALNRMLGQE